MFLSASPKHQNHQHRLFFSSRVGKTGNFDRQIRNERLLIRTVLGCRLVNNRLLRWLWVGIEHFTKQCLTLVQPFLLNRACPTGGREFSMRDLFVGNPGFSADDRIEINLHIVCPSFLAPQDAAPLSIRLFTNH